MHRTEGTNNLANLFTDGPPGTTVEEDWLNAVQEEIAYIIEQAGVTLKTAATETRQQLKEALDLLYSALNGSLLKRPIFVYNGGVVAYTIKAGNGAYRVKDKIAKWSSQLTTNAIAAPGANTRYYLYLDYSAITSWTEITATELIWSSTAPTYSHTYGGWYNGDDLCIFGTITNAGPTDILEFFHDGGDYVGWANFIDEVSALAPSDTFTDVDMASSMPAFSTKGRISFGAYYSDLPGYAYCRTNGQTGSSGIEAASIVSTSTRSHNSLIVFTDSSQIIEVKFGFASVGSLIEVNNDGWFFPIGM